MSKIFASDSTPSLIKKYFVYKLMGSDLFINYSLFAMNLCYKIFGVKMTNFMINNSVASIFTSGETLQTLKKDREALESTNVFGIGNYVAEGLPVMDEQKVQYFYEHMLEHIK